MMYHKTFYETTKFAMLLLIMLLFSLLPSEQLPQDHPDHLQHQHQQQQSHLMTGGSSNSINNTIILPHEQQRHHNNKKLSFDVQNQSLNKLKRYLSERQHELIERNPGSLLAIARAIKMTISECQHQMRHEAWDCPVQGFSIHPANVFGKLMSRSFKETSFIHALLSAAIAHSIARACTESTITTCQSGRTREGDWRENFDFGIRFSQEFMDATHEFIASSSTAASSASPSSSSMSSSSSSSSLMMNNLNVVNFDKNHINNNIISGGSGAGSGDSDVPAASGFMMEPSRRDRRIRTLINRHNDEVGRLLIANGMHRDCKCHGLSGACNFETCWLKLPPFRDVASKLHDSLDQAIRVIYVNQNPTNRQMSLTPTVVKKSNKKRSSVNTPVNSPTRSSISSSSSSAFNSPTSFSPSYRNLNSHTYPFTSSNLLTSNTAIIIGSRVRVAKKHTNTDDCENCYRSNGLNGGSAQASAQMSALKTGADNSGDQPVRGDNQSIQTMRTNSSVVKKRPVAHSIGIALSTITPSKMDILFYEDSPNFCEPFERYNIKGTKGRICSEHPNDINNCESLCCGRGYKTEVREEKYKCDCLFKFCCKLDCNTCTKRKVVHKCL